MAGDDPTTETNDNKASEKHTNPVVTHTLESESNPAEDSDKPVSKDILLQQRISDRTRANTKKEQKVVRAAPEVPEDLSKPHQE
eukprot:15365944-Ditylum_brightwellii.AAC.1